MREEKLAIVSGARRCIGRALAAVLTLSTLGSAVEAQVTVVNIIPNSRSGETRQDSEPNIAVDPADPLRIAGTAFTPDPMGGPNAPIYVSTDGGNIWVLNSIVPGNGTVAGTGDITVSFGGSSHVLYAGILRGDSSLHLNILRTTDFTLNNPMEILVNRQGQGVDQPFIQATTVLGGSQVGKDHVYVGDNDFNVVNGRTASVDLSLDARAVAPPFSIARIEKRTTCAQDGPQIRPAWHWDGTVYAVFYGWRTCNTSPFTSDLVVVRDDNWASGATPFTSLVDSGDSIAGRKVATNVRVPWSNAPTLGQERLGGSLSIAVDPRDSSRVYIAYADFPGGNPPYTLHVRRSDDRGQTWTADLLTVSSALNPSLAVNIHGKVAFLYQQVVNVGGSDRWETHLRRSTDEGGNWNDMTLATTPATTPAFAFLPYIGDYADLQAVGKDFYGIFSANNRPDLANFPQGVTYQRNANFTTNVLLNTDNATPVSVSIDPFFFKVEELAPALDFYVRDWTNTAVDADPGLEPSTDPAFYNRSDVWNRRGTLPGPFPNDQPSNEAAGNGAGIIGDNWAFARIRLRAPSTTTQTVNAHFLVSKFGTGSNYVDSTVMDPDVNLPGPDPQLTFNPGQIGPQITPAYYWHLNAVNSSHLCLAVEVSSTDDPYVAPSLRGYAPGWPTTDLRVLLDNNKAQRNLGLSTTPARGLGGTIELCGIVHNPATFRRDVILRHKVPPSVFPRIRDGYIDVVGVGPVPLATEGTLTLRAMDPGENRWLCVGLPAVAGTEGEVLAVDFQEFHNDQPLDGFGIGIKLSPVEGALSEALERHRSAYTRLHLGFGIAEAEKEASDAEALRRGGFTPESYRLFLASHLGAMYSTYDQLLATYGSDPFGSRQKLDRMQNLLASGQPAERVAIEHASFLNRLDSLLTLHQVARGDVADILQNVRWQKDLFLRVERLTRVSVAGSLVNVSRTWAAEYGGRRRNNEDYPQHLKIVVDLLSTATGELQSEVPRLPSLLAALESARTSGDLTAMQKAHRDVLLALQTLETSGSVAGAP
ncbi:MAG TPA: hypothetical protein VE685_07900 [Thermoanaerobaculia bacterium]|nr:hypothetical protein [Thermoanaerobaculia bacterium]